MRLSTLDMIAFVLTIVGGLNWGLVGLANFNAVGMILGADSMLSRLVYIVVGVSAVYLAINVMKFEKR